MIVLRQACRLVAFGLALFARHDWSRPRGCSPIRPSDWRDLVIAHLIAVGIIGAVMGGLAALIARLMVTA